MATFRLSESAREDIASILWWSFEQFGDQAQKRYEALIVAAIRDAASARVLHDAMDVGQHVDESRLWS